MFVKRNEFTQTLRYFEKNPEEKLNLTIPVFVAKRKSRRVKHILQDFCFFANDIEFLLDKYKGFFRDEYILYIKLNGKRAKELIELIMSLEKQL